MTPASISVFGLGYVENLVCPSAWRSAGTRCWGKLERTESRADLRRAGARRGGQRVDDGLRSGLKWPASGHAGHRRGGPQRQHRSLASARQADATEASTSARSSVCVQIGEAIASKDSEHIVVVRSTILPGTMRSTVIPTLEQASGRTLGEGLMVCNNPEFLREGTAVADFYSPPKTVIGGTDDRAIAAVAALYDGIDAPLVLTSWRSPRW